MYKIISDYVEVKARLDAGEPAALIAADQWVQMKNIVVELNIKTGKHLDKLIVSDKIILWCALCEKYDECSVCPLPVVDNGYICRCKESVYSKVIQAYDHESLVSAIDVLIETLKKAADLKN